jgi:U4/U6 small nuclear ribonucleoprotein PRP3
MNARIGGAPAGGAGGGLDMTVSSVLPSNTFHTTAYILPFFNRTQAIRAQIAARMAALGRPPAPGSGQASPSLTPQPVSTPPSASVATPAPASTPSSNLPADLQARLAAMKEKFAARQAGGSVPPSITGQEPSTAVKKGGLSSIPVHPSLVDLVPGLRAVPGEGIPSAAGGTVNRTKGKTSRIMAPKFTSVAANARLASTSVHQSGGKREQAYTAPTRPTLIAPVSNPHLSNSSVDPEMGPDVQAAQSEMDGLAARRRKATLHFNAKGKYIQRAEELRKEAKMEELRQRIVEQSRKAGLDSEFEVLERNIRRQAPPEVEWWDAPLLENASYEDIDRTPQGGLVKVDDVLVSIYVQHPVPIPAPFEGKNEVVRGLMLTKKVSVGMERFRSLR